MQGPWTCWKLEGSTSHQHRRRPESSQRRPQGWGMSSKQPIINQSIRVDKKNKETTFHFESDIFASSHCFASIFKGFSQERVSVDTQEWWSGTIWRNWSSQVSGKRTRINQLRNFKEPRDLLDTNFYIHIEIHFCLT